MPVIDTGLKRHSFKDVAHKVPNLNAVVLKYNTPEATLRRY